MALRRTVSRWPSIPDTSSYRVPDTGYWSSILRSTAHIPQRTQSASLCVLRGSFTCLSLFSPAPDDRVLVFLTRQPITAPRQPGTAREPRTASHPQFSDCRGTCSPHVRPRWHGRG